MVRIIENELSNNTFAIDHEAYELFASRISKVEFNKDNRRNGLHKHNVYEMCICTKGSGEFKSGEKNHKIVEDTIFVGQPHVVHEILVNENEEMELLFFVVSVSEKSSASRRMESNVVSDFIAGHTSLRSRAKEIKELAEFLYRHPMHFEEASSKALMEALILACFSALRHEETPKDEKEEIVAYINANISRKLSVIEIARRFSMSERSLYYFFKEEFDTSPAEYINLVKMSTAAAYLDMGVFPRDIADMLGFSEISSLSRTFKRIFGLSPTEYSKGINKSNHK